MRSSIRYRKTKRNTGECCEEMNDGVFDVVTGSVLVSDCVRCPAGKFAEIEGMSECKCITEDSCGMESYFAEEIDFYRESIPFVGRW